MIEIYAKKQRAKRKDPQQESIVSEKDKLNERTTKLIALMKAMKSGWNGGPSPDIGVDKFNLTQPMPDVVVGSGDAALRELSEIVQMLRQIKIMQDSYSSARIQRQEQMKQLQQSSTQQTVQSTTSSLSSFFVKEASNPISRIWSHIVSYNPFSNEKNRGERLSLLRSLGRLDDNLQEIEDNVLSIGESSILDSVYIAKQLYSDAKSSFFVNFRKNITKILEETDKELDQLKKQLTVAREGEKNQLVQNDNRAVLQVIDEAKQIINEPIIDIVKEQYQEEKPLSTNQVTFPSKDNLEENKGHQATTIEPIVQENKPLVQEKVKPEKVKKRRKKKIPIAPVVETPKSDFIDSEFEKNQEEEQKYRAIVSFLYTNIDNLIKEAFSISNGNLFQPWKQRAIQEYRKAYQIANNILLKINNGEDYEIEYVSFLRSIGIIKSIDYISSVEKEAIEKDDTQESGFMFNENDLISHGDNFARAEFSKYNDLVSSKVSVAASTTATRFIKRMITHIIPRRDRSLRLTISRNIRQTRRGLQKMLNLLEQKHLDFRSLISVSDEFFESLRSCYENLADLADMYNATMRIEKAYKKQNKERMMHDLIPTIDITALRTIQRHIEFDNVNIQKLQDLEISMIEASESLENRMSNE